MTLQYIRESGHFARICSLAIRPNIQMHVLPDHLPRRTYNQRIVAWHYLKILIRIIQVVEEVLHAVKPGAFLVI